MAKPKSSIEQLSAKERELLARLYETDHYKVLIRLIEIERLELAKDHVDETDISTIRYLSGQARGLKKLVGTIRDNYTKTQKT